MTEILVLVVVIFFAALIVAAAMMSRERRDRQPAPAGIPRCLQCHRPISGYGYEASHGLVCTAGNCGEGDRRNNRGRRGGHDEEETEERQQVQARRELPQCRNFATCGNRVRRQGEELCPQCFRRPAGPPAGGGPQVAPLT